MIEDFLNIKNNYETVPKTNRQKMFRSVYTYDSFPAYVNEEWCALRYADGKWHRQGVVADTWEECEQKWKERSNGRD